MPATMNDQLLWNRRFWLLTGAMWVLHLAMFLVLDLSPDEAYYWEFARRLDWSYFDHPPMVGYLIALGKGLFGDSHLAVRLPALLAMPIVAWMIFRLGCELSGPVVGFVASALFQCSPAGVAFGLITTPDTPLALTWGGAALAFFGWLREGGDRRWLLIGLAFGLGGLSKYTIVFLAPGVIGTLLVVPRLRSNLTRGWFWAAVLIALLGALPVIYWNWQHDWISFKFQLQHGLKSAPRSLEQNVGEFLGGQLGTMGPFIFLLLIWRILADLLRGWREMRAVGGDGDSDDGSGAVRAAESRFALAAMAAPMAMFFLVNGCRSKVEANWPQPAYLTAFPLVADWLCATAAVAATGVTTGSWRRFWIAAAPTFLLALLATVQAFTLIIPLPPGNDISTRLHGWREFGAEIASEARVVGDSAVFVTQGSTLSALAGFYGGLPVGRAVEIHRQNNWRFWWAEPTIATGTDIVFVDLDDHPELVFLTPHFREVEPTRAVAIRYNGRLIRNARFTRLRGHLGTLQLK